MSRHILFLAIALSIAPMTAIACGACVEDLVAATYDHAVMTKAAARRHVVVFASVDYAGDAKYDVREISMAAAASKGVDADSVRISDQPSALSFALNPAARSPEAALADIQTRLRAKGVRLTVLRVTR